MQPMQETTAWVVVNEEGRPMVWTVDVSEGRSLVRYLAGEPSAACLPHRYTVRPVRITEVAP